MKQLRYGAVEIHLPTGRIYGDTNRISREALLESAEVLMSLQNGVEQKGLWGLGKAYDSDCYILTTNRNYHLPDNLCLPSATNRPVKFIAIKSKPEDIINNYFTLVA